MLQFLGDIGVYVPSRDAIKFTAVRSGFPVECYVRRSALIAIGCQPSDDAAMLCTVFERQRALFERVAAAKYAQGTTGSIGIGFPDVLSVIEEAAREPE